MWVSLLVSNSGAWMQSVAQDLLVYDLTQSALNLGLVSMVKAIAMISLSFVGGTIADRLDKRKLLMFTQISFSACAIVLGLLVSLGVVQVWHVLAISFIHALLLALDQPARQSILPDLVPREHLLNAIALNSVTWVGAAAFGPALAGPVIAVLGMAWGFFLNGLGILTVVRAVWLLKLPKREDKPTAPVGSAIREGLQYVARSRSILTLIGLLIMVSLMSASYQSLLPVFARLVFAGDYRELGYLRAAPGIGALVGGFILTRIPSSPRRGYWAPIGGLMFGTALLFFSSVSTLWIGLCFLFVGGLALTMMQSVVQTLMQHHAGDVMRGRVMSLYALCVMGIGPLGSLPLGWTADRFGVGFATRLGASVAVAYAAGVFLLARRRLMVEP